MERQIEQINGFSYNPGMPLPPDIDFAEFCKELRAKGKYTQQEMADKLGATLVGYQMWEYGKRKPSAKFAVRILALRDEMEAKKRKKD
jgi:transcriptional regulator with XRE-family HTH domain